MTKQNVNLNEQDGNFVQPIVSSSKSFFRRLLAKWINVDLERYDNLKSENKKIKIKLQNIENELKLQITEMKLPCKVIPESMNDHYPKGNELKDIADAYNRCANSERLIYVQKLQFIKTILDK